MYWKYWLLEIMYDRYYVSVLEIPAIHLVQAEHYFITVSISFAYLSIDFVNIWCICNSQLFNIGVFILVFVFCD